MPKKLTLEMKKQISREVLAETKRCIAIVNKLSRDTGWIAKAGGTPVVNTHIQQAVKDIVNGCPYLEFNPGLKKLIPKG